MKPRILHLIIFAVLFSFGFSTDAAACRCQPVPKTGEQRTAYLEKQFQTGDFVFLATVTEERDGTEQSKKFWDFKVEKVWKGDVPAIVTYESSQGMCSIWNFKKGETYLIYASTHQKDDTNNLYDISSCSYTRPAAEAQDAIALMDKN